MSTRLVTTECFEGRHGYCAGHNGPANNPNFLCDCFCHATRLNLSPVEDERVKEEIMSENNWLEEANKVKGMFPDFSWPGLSFSEAVAEQLVQMTRLPVQPAASTPDVHSLKRFALSGRCDNRLHSECPYPERCLCDCHTAAASTEAQDEHPYYKHVRNCQHCSGPHGHCVEGLQLLNAGKSVTPPDFTEQAREIVMQTYTEGCEWHGPTVEATCERFHREQFIKRISSLATSAHTEGVKAERKRIHKLISEMPLTLTIGGYIRAKTPAETAADILAAIGHVENQEVKDA